MSIQQIGFDQGPQGLEGSRNRYDKPTSHANTGTQSENGQDDSVGRAGVAKSTAEFNRLTAQSERRYAVAANIRTTDQTMEQVGATVDAMKKDLEVIVKNYPPYPPGSEERVKRLKSYAGLRAMINRLTVPPDESTQKNAGSKSTDAQPTHQYTFMIGADGRIRTVPKDDVKIGAAGLPIPELSPPAASDDQAIGQALQQLDTAGATIQARRDALRTQTLAPDGLTPDQSMSDRAAEGISIQVRQDLGTQPVGIAHEGTAQLDQLLG
jgi:hypothetical protein